MKSQIIVAVAALLAIVGTLLTGFNLTAFRTSKSNHRTLLSILLGLGLAIVTITSVTVQFSEHRKSEQDANRVLAEQARIESQRRAEDQKREDRLKELLARISELEAKTNNPEIKKETETLKTEITNLVSLVKIVTVHVGGDDSKSGTFNYAAPDGYTIRDYRFIERSKGGDAHYSASLTSPTNLQVKWSVKSRTIRGPFKTVINTITSFLNLDAQITLQPATKGT